MTWLIARLKEPSTWAGLAVIVDVIHTAANSVGPSVSLAGFVSAVVTASVAVVMKEGV